MADRTLSLKILGDASSVKSAFGDVDGAASKSSGFLGGWGNSLAKSGMAMVGIGTAIDAVEVGVDVVMGLAYAAADLGEAQSKASAIFGSSVGIVDNFGASAAKAYGMSNLAATSSAASFGMLLEKTGQSGDDIATMSTSLTGLSADLASFNNLAQDDVAQKLFAGLTGEAEPLKALGVFLSADAVEAKALQMGLGDMNGELTESEKIQARYALIMEQTSTAQGDYARTANSLPNVQRTLSAQWEDMKAKLGEGLLPAITTLVQGISAMIPVMTVVLGAAFTFIGESIMGFGIIFGKVFEAFKLAWEVATAATSAASEIIGAAVSAIAGFFSDSMDKVQVVTDAVWGFLESAFRAGADFITGVWEEMTGFLSEYIENTWNGIKGVIEGGVQVVQGIIQTFSAALRGDWSGMWDGIKTTLSGAWDMIKSSVGMYADNVKLILTTAFGDMARSVGDKVSEMINFVQEIPGKVTSALGDLGGLLVNAGRSLLQGLIDGIEEKIQSVKDTLSRVTSLIPDWKGPPVKDASLLRGAGQLIMGGLTDGLMDGWTRDVAPTLSGFSGAIVGEIGSGRAISQPFTSRGAGGDAPIIINMNISNPDPRAVVAAVREAIRTQGRRVIEP